MGTDLSPRAIAHDLANVLGTIEGATDLLMEQLAHTSACPLVEEIRSAAHSACAISRALVADAAAPAVSAALDPTIERAAGALRRLAGEHVEVELVLGAPGAVVPANPAALTRILVNLVVNAREAMPAGGLVRIVTQDCPDGAIELSVADTGCGIPADACARLFHESFTTKGADRGHGLAIVEAIAAASGGSIHVSSALGAGALFRVRWALRPESPRPSEPVAASAAPSLLLVDDDDAILEILAEYLEQHGIAVIAAADAATAVDSLRSTVSAAVIDLHLGGGDGRAVGMELRRGRPDLPLLYMSGLEWRDPEVQTALADGGATSFLGKPFGLTQFLDAVLALTLKR